MNAGKFLMSIEVGMKTDETNRINKQIQEMQEAFSIAADDMSTTFVIPAQSAREMCASAGANFKKLFAGIKEQLKGGTGEFDKSGKQVGSVFESMGLDGTQVMSALIDAIAEVCKALNQMVEAWYQVDVVIDNLNSKLSSTAEVHDYICDSANELRITYSTMADSVSDLVRTGNALFQTTEEATDFLTLTDKMFKASGATESEIASLNNSLVESFRTGRVSASAFNNIMTTSPETIDLLAESLNLTTQQVKALGTQGKITAKQLYEAFEESANEIEESFSNVRVTISEALTEFKNSIGTIVTNLNDSLHITDIIAGALEGILNLIEPIFRLITTNLSFIGDTIQGIMDLVAPINDAVSEFFNMFMDAISEIVGALNGIINSVIQPIIDIVSKCVGSVMRFVNKIMPLVQKILDVVVGVVDMLAGIITDALETVFDVVNKVLDPIINLLDTIMDLIDPLIDLIMNLLDVVMDLIGSIFDSGFMDTIGEVLGTIIDTLTPIIDMLTNMLAPIMEMISSLLSSIFDILSPIFSILSVIIDIIQDFMNLGLMQVLEPVMKIIEIISGLIQALMGDTTALKETFASIGEWFQNIWDKIKAFFQKIKDAMNQIKEFFQNIFKSIGNFFIKIINGLISGFESFVNFFVKAINGLTAGLSKMWTWLGIPAIPQINEVSFKRISYLAEGGYAAPNRPQLAVIGDNPREGEIVAPESKIREQVELAFQACISNFSPQAKMAAISGMNGITDNRVYNTTTQIYNTFNGSMNDQKTSHKAAKDIEDQIIGRIANVLAGER